MSVLLALLALLPEKTLEFCSEIVAAHGAFLLQG
jgi:hypothetical protein